MEQQKSDYELLKCLGEELSLYRILEIIGKEIKKRCSLPSYYFAFLDYENQNLIIENMDFDKAFHDIDLYRKKSKFPLEMDDFNVNCFNKNANVYINENELVKYPVEVRKFYEVFKVQHAVCIPISRSNEVIGVVCLISHDSEIDRSEIGKVNDLVNKYYPQIKNSLTYTRLKEKQEEIKNEFRFNEKYLQIVERISDLSTVEKVYSLVIKEITELYQYDIGFLLLEENGKLLYQYGYNSSKKHQSVFANLETYLSGHPVLLQDTDIISAECFLRKSHHYLPDIEKILHLSMSKIDSQLFDILKTPKSGVIIPVMYHQKPIGIIELFSLEKVRNIDENRLRMLRSLAGSLGTNIANAKIYSVVEQQRAEILETNNELESLSEISKQVSRSLDFKGVFYSIFRHIQAQYGFNGVHLNLVSHDKQQFIVELVEYPGFLSPFKKEYEGKHFPLDEKHYKTAECILKNQVFFYPDTPAAYAEENLDLRMTELLKIRSVLHVPIDTGEEVFGSFFLIAHEKPVQLDQRDIRSIQRFVSQIAVTLRNTKLYSELKRRKEEIENINEFSLQISMTMDYKLVINNIVNFLKNKFGFNGNNLNLVTADKKHFVIDTVHCPEKYRKSAETLLGKIYPLNEEGGRAAECILKNKSYYFTDINIENIQSEINKTLTEELDIKTIVHIPIRIEGEVIGSFALMSQGKCIMLSDEDIETIERYVNQIAIVLRNSKIYEELKIKSDELERKDSLITQDLNLAKKIQLNILSKDYKQSKYLDFSTFFEPMMEVGGDIYDIFEIKPNYYRIFIADATGHGVQAALATMLIKSEYDKIKFHDISPGFIIQQFNNNFIKGYENINVYLTCVLADIDLMNNKVIYSSAGHPDQYIITGKKLESFHKCGPMIGLLKDSIYETDIRDFLPETKIILFTDGVYEIFADNNDEFGEQRLFSVINDYKNESIHTICKKIIESVNSWNKNKRYDDDITLVGCERKAL